MKNGSFFGGSRFFYYFTSVFDRTNETFRTSGTAQTVHELFTGKSPQPCNASPFDPAIALEVLEEFRKLTEKTVVWVRRERMWRLREKGDPPGRMVD